MAYNTIFPPILQSSVRAVMSNDCESLTLRAPARIFAAVPRFSFIGLLFILAGSVSIAASQTPAPVQQPKLAVYSMQSDYAIVDFKDDPAVVHRMVDFVVAAATGKNDTSAAWRSLVKPSDRVGIKISTLGGRIGSTHRSVVDAVINGLESAGVPRKNILVWDRSGLADAGWGGRTGDFQVRSIEPIRGYDPQAVITSGVLGKLIWGDVDFLKRDEKNRGVIPAERDQLSAESHLCKIVSREVDKIINVPVLISSESCGVAGCLYNVTVPNVDNWRRFTESDSFIPDVYIDERVGPKVVLNIMDALLAQYAGGPDFQPNYILHHGTVYASKDPVALDVTALALIEKWRVQAKLPRVAPRAAYLQTAALMGIGSTSAENIELSPLTPR
jgi:uncharacterized protein (DUF362 family)